MKITDYAIGMAEYGAWMNGRLFAVAAELSDEERKRDLGAFFGSLHRTLNHILLGDEAWLQRLQGRAVTMTSPGQELYPDFEELREARRDMDVRIRLWAESVSEDFAASAFSFYSVSYGKSRVLPGWAAIVQMFNHQTHHRGQATTLLKQLGKDPGITDFPWMPWFDDWKP